MKHILLLYGSEEGQTARVAKKLASAIQQAGHRATLIDGRELPEDFSLTPYDAVLVGASVHVGRHQRYVVDFVRTYRAGLGTLPTALFSVSLAAASNSPERQEQAKGYIDSFIQETSWQPDLVCAVAGALHYSRYDELQLFILQLAGAWGGDEDGQQDVEYTDWDVVARFANAFLEVVIQKERRPT